MSEDKDEVEFFSAIIALGLTALVGFYILNNFLIPFFGFAVTEASVGTDIEEKSPGEIEITFRDDYNERIDVVIYKTNNDYRFVNKEIIKEKSVSDVESGDSIMLSLRDDTYVKLFAFNESNKYIIKGHELRHFYYNSEPDYGIKYNHG